MKALITFAPELPMLNLQSILRRMLVSLFTGLVFLTSLLNANAASEPGIGSLPYHAEWVECVSSDSALDFDGEELPESEALEGDFGIPLLIKQELEHKPEATRGEHPQATELHLPPPEGRC